MRDLETDRLIVRSRRDPASFARLIALFQTRLYSYLARMTGPEGAAVLFEPIWVEIHNRSARYAVGGSACAWIFNVAHQCAGSHYREIPQRPTDTGGIRVRNAASLRAAFEALPVAPRTVFLLREYGGLSFQEISQILRVELDAVLSSMNDALDRLRGDLEAFRA